MRVDESQLPSGLSLPEEARERVLNRLVRLEGQARGVQRMVREGRDCREIMNQIAAIKAAAHSLGTVVLEHYVVACLDNTASAAEDTRTVVRGAIRQMSR